MALSGISVFFVVIFSWQVSAVVGDEVRGFLVRRGGLSVEAALQDLLINQNSADSSAQRWKNIELHMSRSVVALPTNSFGRLSSQAVRYLVHGYFVQEHGWLIRGLGPHAPRENSSELHEATILRDKAPGILEALLKARQFDEGFLLSDAAAMAATLERLIVEECLELMKLAYEVNGFSLTDVGKLNKTEVREVLLSFLLFFELGVENDAGDPDTHLILKDQLHDTVGAPDNFWEKLDDFQNDIVQEFVFNQRSSTNPFVSQTFSFDAVSRLVESLAHRYGKWQDSECQMMKAELMSLDAEGFGRVALSHFYSQREHVVYKFGESVDYLRTIGALDERLGHEPRVIIANYLAGPSNCVAGSSYYSVCCLSECEGLMNELEEQVRAPADVPERLVALVSNMSSTTVEGPRQLPKVLTKRLGDIASLHDGVVPLHGRLFAQWLHYAFPLECQYPQHRVAEAVLTPMHWQEKGHSATDAEKEQIIKLASAAAENAAYMPVGDGADEAEQEIPQWSEDEVLPFHGMARRRLVAWIASAGRGAAGIAVLFAALRTVITTWSATVSARRGEAPDAVKPHFV